MSRFRGAKRVGSVWVRLNRQGHDRGAVLESQRSSAVSLDFETKGYILYSPDQNT